MNGRKGRVKRVLAFAMALTLVCSGANSIRLSAEEGNVSDIGGEDLDLIEESIDFGEYVIQEGGMKVWQDRSANTFSLNGERAAQADLERAQSAILQALLDWQPTVDITDCNIPKDELAGLMASVFNQNPDLFYADAAVSCLLSNGLITEITLKYNNGYTKDNVAEYEAALEKAYNEAITDDNMSELQKARALHDYLAQHMCYDGSYKKYNAYNALVEGTAVCQGYSLAYSALLKKAGIEFDYCLSSSMKHEWNYVKIEGAWYHVDVTWDDPTADRVGRVQHKYFLCSDAQMNEGGNGHHDWVHVQECTSTSYDDAYWKDDSLSAIFYIDGGEYYLRISDSGLSVMKREGGTETALCTVPAIWLDANGAFWKGNYSGFSYYGGNLYFNDSKNVYEFQLEGSEPKVIHTINEDSDIYGSLVCDGQITLGLAQSPNDNQNVKRVPLGEVKPTDDPTTEPTDDPTTEPTDDPTTEPTDDPTTEPTDDPTTEPTDDPTTEPTDDSTTEPTDDPTTEPTDNPTTEPTDDPTTEPTDNPTTEPTSDPTTNPTGGPVPTAAPEKTPAPTLAPEETPAPTVAPEETLAPTVVPEETSAPTATPEETPAPTATPEETSAPTATPEETSVPTASPEETPIPTVEPTPAPTTAPTAAPEPEKKPFIQGESGKEGWDAIKEDATNAVEGKWITVNMNGASTVPGHVLDNIKGKNVTLAFNIGNGVIWYVNGKNVTSDRASDVNFSVQVGTSVIPQDILGAVAGNRSTTQLSLAHSGEFGYGATLAINVGSVNAGLYANLFYYNAGAGRLEYICADVIDGNGLAELPFTHASDYVVVIDEKDMGASDDGSSDDDSEATGADNDNAQEPSVHSPKTGEKDILIGGFQIAEAQSEGSGMSFIWIVLIGAAVMAVAGTVAFLIRKKEK